MFAVLISGCAMPSLNGPNVAGVSLPGAWLRATCGCSSMDGCSALLHEGLVPVPRSHQEVKNFEHLRPCIVRGAH